MKKYHDLIIDSFCDNLSFFVKKVGFIPSYVKRNYSLGSFGDIAILLFGEKDEIAVIEVKGHQGLLGKFERRQLPKYKERFPGADFYALIGCANKSLSPKDLDLRKYL